MSDTISLLEAGDNLMKAEDILSFLAGVTPHPGTVMGEDGEHGNQLILFRVIELVNEAKKSVEAHRKQAN